MVNIGHPSRAGITTAHTYILQMVTNFVFSQWDQSEDNHKFQQQQEGQRKKPLSGLAREDARSSLWNVICQSINWNPFLNTLQFPEIWEGLALFTSES